MKKRDILKELREGERLGNQDLLRLIIQLSIPAILAQISSIVMQYIDASMVGHLSSVDSASIGLVASSTWLLGGLSHAVNTGFTVQVAHLVGAGKNKEARAIVKQSLLIAGGISLVLMLMGVIVHRKLPFWLGGEGAICSGASAYFLIFALALPVQQLNHLSSGMLQCSGNMKVPSILHVCMCVMDVIFNGFFIFPTWTCSVGALSLQIPGAGLGVAGAALGTAAAQLVTMLFMLYFMLLRSPELHLRMREHGFKEILDGERVKTAFRIGVPMAMEQTIMSSAYIMATRIVAPLGMTAIAANSFSVTAESLVYMPGYGIGMAATTMIGQSLGAKREQMAKKLAWMTTALGMAVMTGTGVLMYMLAPVMIGILSPDPAIRALGATVLRIEAFAEPLYGASIVVNGVFRGAGDTLMSSCLNLLSMWCVRLPLSAVLAVRYGLEGVWIAMCLELCFRGTIFLARLATGKCFKHKIL